MNLMDSFFRIVPLTWTDDPQTLVWQAMHQGSCALPLCNSDKPAIVDTALFPALSKHSWKVSKLGYCYRYERVGEKGALIYLHRDVMRLCGCEGEKVCIDHVNQDRLDNRQANLRFASKSENMCNRGATSKNTSGYKGVYLQKATGRWRAYIKKDYKQVYLGVFETREEAALAYNKAALDLHGGFAHLNLV